MDFLEVFGAVCAQALGDCHHEGVHQGGGSRHGMVFSGFAAVNVQVHVGLFFFWGVETAGEAEGPVAGGLLAV